MCNFFFLCASRRRQCEEVLLLSRWRPSIEIWLWKMLSKNVNCPVGGHPAWDVHIFFTLKNIFAEHLMWSKFAIPGVASLLFPGNQLSFYAKCSIKGLFKASEWQKSTSAAAFCVNTGCSSLGRQNRPRDVQVVFFFAHLVRGNAERSGYYLVDGLPGRFA